jgi:hypothetical protein
VRKSIDKTKSPAKVKTEPMRRSRRNRAYKKGSMCERTAQQCYLSLPFPASTETASERTVLQPAPAKRTAPVCRASDEGCVEWQGHSQ